MKCRKLYKDFEKGNYNLVFFKSQGMKFPYEIRISIFSTRNSSGGSTLEDKKIIDSETYYNQTESSKLYELSFFEGLLTLGLSVVKDFKNIFNTKLDNIHFHYEGLDEFYVTIYVITPEGKTSFIIDSINIIFDGVNYDYYYIKDNLAYIPFKKFGIAIKDTDNYAGKQEGVAYSLTQRLSVLKGELWYQINHGLPLLDKVRSGQIFDSVIINIILSHPDVVNIESFNSYINNNHNYYFDATISTIYNENITISNTY